MKSMDIVFLWLKNSVLLLCLLCLTIGCAGTSLTVNIANDPNIKNLKSYNNFSVSKWQNTKLQVEKGEAILLTPLYPRGFIYIVKGKIKGSNETFDALDVDIGNIYTANTAGILQIGLDKKVTTTQTGVFIFRSDNTDNIISDLNYIQANNKDVKVINLTLGILFMKKSDILISNNSNAEALGALDNALSCFKKVDKKLYSTTIYRLHKTKASLYKKLGDFAKFSASINQAMESMMKASEYYSKLSDPQYSFLKAMTQEERFLLLTKTRFFSKSAMPVISDIGHGFANLPVAYAFLSKYYTDTGNLQLSLRYSEKAIELAKRDGNQNLVAWTYQSLGYRHRRLGFYPLAEKAYLTALDHCANQAVFSHRHFRWELAFTRYLINQSDSSVKTLKRIETELNITEIEPMFAMKRIMTGAFGMGGPDEEEEEESTFPVVEATGADTLFWQSTWVSYLLGRIDMEQGNYKEAIRRLKRVYSSIKSICGTSHLSNRNVFVNAGLYLCQSYIGLGLLDEARQLLSKIEADIAGLGSPINLKLEAMIIKSRLMGKMGKDPVVPLMEAIDSLERIRPTATNPNDYEYWERMLTVYNNAVGSLYDRGDFEKALEVAEKARSRRFLDYLGNKKLGAKATAEDILTRQADENLEALSILENDMIRAAISSGVKVRSLYHKGTRYSKRLENCRNILKEARRSDRQFGIMHNIIPVSPKEIQQKLPDNVTIVEYYLSDNALYAWVIDHGSINAVKRDVSRDRIKNLIVALRNSISADTVKRGVAVSKKTAMDVKNPERKIYDLLMLPVESHVKTNRISIVPYGILNYIPFQALHDGNQYLVEKYAISYVPSLSVLEFLKKGEKKDSFKILALGNPDLNDETLDLPAAGKEVEMIKALFPSATVFKRGKATEATVKRLARQYDIIHFASHGEYFPESPLDSCLRLSPGQGDDGRLEAGEVFDMDINSDIVVTSACQTAIGQIGKGDEIVGLTRAFIYAGANSVFGSLWNISDEATAVLMKEFYSNINRLDNAEALRQAQLKMIRSGNYANPFYWSAFNITGGFDL